MQIKAIYNQGRLEFSTPIRLSQQEFAVVVDLPDEVILSTETSSNEVFAPPPEVPGAELLGKFRRIMGSMHRERPSASVEEDKDAYAKALGEKYSK